jgi:Peptidase family M23
MRRFLLAVVVLLGLPVSAAQAWTWPVAGPVLETFSFDRAHPYASGERRGIEIGAGDGESVAAPAGGTVSFAGSVPGSGVSLTIETADGYSVTLTHLRALGVAKGASVGEGTAVATAAASMHLGIRVTADPQGYVDPLALLPARPSPPPSQPAPSPPPQPAPASAPPPPPTTVSAPVAAPQPAPTDASQAPPAESTPEAVLDEPDGPGIQVVAAADARPGVVVHRAAITVALRRPAALPPAVARPVVVRDPVRIVLPTHAPRVRPAPQVPVLRRTLPPEVVSAPPVTRSTHAPRVPLWLAGTVALLVAVVLAVLVRMILGSSRQGAHAVAVPEEDPRRACVAVRERAAAPGPCRGAGRARRHLRALPPVARQRRSEGERHRRARHARDGLGRPRRRVAA